MGGELICAPSDEAWRIADEILASRKGAGYHFSASLTNGEVVGGVPMEMGADGPVRFARGSENIVFRESEGNMRLSPYPGLFALA